MFDNLLQYIAVFIDRMVFAQRNYAQTIHHLRLYAALSIQGTCSDASRHLQSR